MCIFSEIISIPMNIRKTVLISLLLPAALFLLAVAERLRHREDPESRPRRGVRAAPAAGRSRTHPRVRQPRRTDARPREPGHRAAAAVQRLQRDRGERRSARAHRRPHGRRQPGKRRAALPGQGRKRAPGRLPDAFRPHHGGGQGRLVHPRQLRLAGRPRGLLRPGPAAERRAEPQGPQRGTLPVQHQGQRAGGGVQPRLRPALRRLLPEPLGQPRPLSPTGRSVQALRQGRRDPGPHGHLHPRARQSPRPPGRQPVLRERRGHPQPAAGRAPAGRHGRV